MPRYKVLEPGFYNKVYHTPGHPRHGVVHTAEPLKPVPSWLEEMKPETPAAAKRRAKKIKEDKEAEAAKAEEDRVARDAMTFVESPKSTVETL